MSKRRNDDALNDNTQANAKRARQPRGFRFARPPAAKSASQSTVPSSSSTTSNSHIRTLAVGSGGRLAGKRKDKSHLTSSAKIIPSDPDLPEDATVIPNEADFPEDLPEDSFQATSTDVQTEPKPKRKRNNNNRVCDSLLTLLTWLTPIPFKVKTRRVALVSRYDS
jgi:hypothetical protein